MVRRYRVDDQATRNELIAAAHRLGAKGFIESGYACVSMRLPGDGQFAIIDVPRPDSDAESTVRIHRLDPTPQRIPTGAQLDFPFDHLHRHVYQERADVGAVFVSHAKWTTWLGNLDRPMPGVFDEQVRHLGESVQELKWSMNGWTVSDRMKLKRGDNAYRFRGESIVLGFNLDRLVFNAELFEKCAKAYILAHATGKRIGRIPWLVRYIARRRLLKDERRAAEAFGRGEIPGGLTAY